MSDRFSEAKPGINRDSLSCDTCRLAALEPFGEKLPNIQHNIIVLKTILHRPRLTQHVHETDTNIGTCNNFESTLLTERTYVIHKMNATFNGSIQNPGIARIYRQTDIQFCAQELNYRDDPGDFFFGRYRQGTRPCGLASYIEHYRASIDHRSRARQHFIKIYCERPRPASGELRSI